MSFAGKTIFITGGSRGIGRAIALRAASEGANIVIAAKTVEPHPKLPGTIYSVAEEIEAAGGKCLPLGVDIRSEDQIKHAIDRAAKHFGGIDILVNNASAIRLTRTEDTPAKAFDLMMQVNLRGTFLCTQAALPYLSRGKNPHVLVLSPPLAIQAKWFKDHCAYTISKYGMSLCVLGMAEEFRSRKIAVNALWPKTVIDTAALQMLGGFIKPEQCRTPAIVADAALAIFKRNSGEFTGNFCLDEEVLRAEGITDLTEYAVDPSQPLAPDLYVG